MTQTRRKPMHSRKRFTTFRPGKLVFVLSALALAGLAPASQFKLATHSFTVPDGFEVEQVAGPPLVNRPIAAAFDEQGRLYVTEQTVKFHLSNIYRKLDVANRTEASRWAQLHGLLPETAAASTAA